MDIDLDVDILNIDVKIGAKGGEEPVSVAEEDEQIQLDLDAMEEETKDKVLDIVKEGYQEEENIFRDTVKKDKENIEENKDNDRIEETLEFFRPKISDRHLEMLEAALYMREAWEEGNPVEKRKQDIVQRYGPEGRSIANLCTAGYFDKGRYLRQLYKEMQDSKKWKEGDYRQEFEEIVKNEPFSVFVSYSHTEQQIKDKIITKLSKYQKYGVDVKFVDVRGIGEGNKRTIQKAMQKLEGQISNIDYDPEEAEGKYRVRIDPESVEGLGSS